MQRSTRILGRGHPGLTFRGLDFMHLAMFTDKIKPVTALIQIENLHYRPETLVPDQPDILRSISLTIEEGDFVAIVGKNGSGKTTLIKHINGLLFPTQGRVQVDGLDTHLPENRARLQSLVGMVFQNPADQIVASTVEEDVAFGLENLNIPTEVIRSRVAEQLSAAGLTLDAARPPHLLSGGQIQKVALAGVLARQPRVILFDEPTSMLDPQTRQSFLKRLEQLHQDGLTIIYVTHHMEEIVNADKVVILFDGQIAHEGSPQEIFGGSVNLYEIGLEVPEVVKIAEIFRSLGWFDDRPILTPRELLDALPVYDNQILRPSKDVMSVPNRMAEPFIQLDDVNYTYLSGSPLAQIALRGANFSVHQGSLSAIAGANGSGKSTLLQHINGILRPDSGHVRVGKWAIEDPQTPLREVIRDVGLVFQNPEAQFFEVFVGDEIAYGPKQFNMDHLRERVRQAMEMVGLDFEAFKDRRLETLSGGEKRKVALASTLVLDQQVLLFDEPTAGMDPQARKELMGLLRALRDQGKTMIIASHRMDELASVAEDLSLMHSGRVIQSGPSPEVFSDSSAIRQAGLLPPLSVQISQKLIEKGWPIEGEDTSTPDRLFSVIKDVVR
jgi:energy-coupling factor transport system ATP-binding protein